LGLTRRAQGNAKQNSQRVKSLGTSHAVHTFSVQHDVFGFSRSLFTDFLFCTAKTRIEVKSNMDDIWYKAWQRIPALILSRLINILPDLA
jgi:hypothetical protein